MDGGGRGKRWGGGEGRGGEGEKWVVEKGKRGRLNSGPRYLSSLAPLPNDVTALSPHPRHRPPPDPALRPPTPRCVCSSSSSRRPSPDTARPARCPRQGHVQARANQHPSRPYPSVFRGLDSPSHPRFSYHKLPSAASSISAAIALPFRCHFHRCRLLSRSHRLEFPAFLLSVHFLSASQQQSFFISPTACRMQFSKIPDNSLPCPRRTIQICRFSHFPTPFLTYASPIPTYPFFVIPRFLPPAS